MTKLKDSGERAVFDTGAVRDLNEGKGRMDLIPLDILVELFPEDQFIANMYKYFSSGDTVHLYNILKANIEYDNIYDLIIDVSKQFQDGAFKYSERNWEKGIPLHRYMDSGLRHYLQYKRGDTDEPHKRASMWNVMCCIWTHKNLPIMHDLPFITKGGNK